MPKTKFDYFQSEDDEVTFTLIDENTVARLQKDGTITLPIKDIDAKKDMRWNMKQLNSKLLQGIMSGDPIPKIAESFEDVIGKNEVSTTRAARTMCTSAENSGRQDSYTNLANQGVIQKKVWIATPDIHTREAHMDADGQEVDIDEPFELINSDGSICHMMFPADPDGDDEQVWNCRCSMRTRIVGFVNPETGEVNDVKHERDTTTHSAQMEEQKQYREKLAEARNAAYATAHPKQIDDEPEGIKYNTDKISEQIKTPAMNEYTYWSDDQTKYRFNAIQGRTGFDDSKTQEVLEAFSGNSNDYLGGDMVPEGWFYRADTRIRDNANEKWANAAKTIDDYIVASPKYDGSIFRGLSLDADTISGIKQGGTFVERGTLSSWTSGADIAQMFAEGRSEELGLTPVIIETRNHPFSTPVSHLSVFGSEENEVIVSNMHGNEYTIDSVEEKGGILHVVLSFKEG